MAFSSVRDPASSCFGASDSGPVATVPLIVVDIAGAQANALAQLVPLLGCGEEAAALAFDDLADREHDPAVDEALRGIADEERIHEQLLLSLMAGLPPVDVTASRRAARRFHIDLGRGSDEAHLARIAAVDAGVCTILSRLLRPGAPLASDHRVALLLARIRHDESRHVMLSRRIAIARGDRRAIEAAAAAARIALADVLTLAADAFETLEVDPGRLLADLRRLPNGLLRA